MGPKGFVERVKAAFEPRTPEQVAPSEEHVKGALDKLGSGDLGNVFTACEREAAQNGRPSETSLVVLKEVYERVMEKWLAEEKLPVHNGHRGEMNTLLNEVAVMLATYGYLK